MAGSRKAIRDDIIAALKNIKTGAGYTHTVKYVDDKRRSLNALKPHDYPAIFATYGAPETIETSTMGDEYTENTLSFLLVCFIKQVKGRSEADDGDAFIDDIKKALVVDRFRGQGVDGNNAEGTFIKSIEMDTMSMLDTTTIDIIVEVPYTERKE